VIPFYHRVCVIGAGNVGCTISRFLYSRGLTVSAVVDRDEMKLERARSAVFADGFSPSPGALKSVPRCFIICVQDGEISGAAEELSRIDHPLDGVFVAHTSGIRTADELLPLASRGAIIGSMHPIQSFPSYYVDISRIEGIGCGLEGNGDFLASGREFADFLGWKPIMVRKELKPLYHLACVFAGNFITSLIAESLDLLEESTDGGAFEHLAPMILGVLNGIEQNSPRAALTGPVARGDADTIRKHLELQREYVPGLVDLYRELVLRSVRLAKLPETKEAMLLEAIGDDETAPG